MNKIRIVRDKEELSGTGYVEVLPGSYQSDCWNKGSLFFDEETFGYLEPCIEEHARHFDHYAFSEISRDTWQNIIVAFNRLFAALDEANGVDHWSLKGKIGFIYTNTKERFGAEFAESKVAGVNLQADLLTAGIMKTIRSRFPLVNTWTANSVAEARRVADLGVDAIISDDPALILAAFR